MANELPAPQKPQKPTKVPPSEAHLAAAESFDRDRDAEHDRLLRILRRKGLFTHAELVELLGAEEVEVEHHDVIASREAGEDDQVPGELGPSRTQHVDDDGLPVFHEQTGLPVMVKAGTRTVAHDSHTSRAFLAAVLGE